MASGECRLFDRALLQKRPMILRSLLIEKIMTGRLSVLLLFIGSVIDLVFAVWGGYDE